MPAAYTTQDLREVIHTIKASSQGFTTSLFASPENVVSWFQCEGVAAHRTNRAFFILRPERDFYRIYHVAEDLEALGEGLATLPPPFSDGTLVADLVGRPPEVAAQATEYAAHGFSPHKTLVRMIHTGPWPGAPIENFPLLCARPEDVGDILAFLERLLDRHAERIPQEEELVAWSIQGRIILARVQDQIAGLLIYRTIGKTSELQFWHVDGRYRGLSIGAHLIRNFFFSCRDSLRLTLWVISDNLDSIDIYKHYGFRRELAVDQIMVKPYLMKESL